MIAVLLSALLFAPDAPAANAPVSVELSRDEEAPKKKGKVCKVDAEDTASKIRRRVCKVENDDSPSGGSPTDNAR